MKNLFYKINQTSTKAYSFVTIINGKEYRIGFEADESDFSKYFPVVKKMINTFKPSEYDEKKSNGYNYNQIDEKQRFKNLIEKQVANKFEWKIYADNIFKFNVSLPYINENNVLKELTKCPHESTNVSVYFRYVTTSILHLTF